MLLWINGPFGGGKTQTAHELLRRLPGSVICDPERAGFGMQRMLPADLRGDFQDFPGWRQSVFEVLDLTLQRHRGTVIAPMTVVNLTYFAETVGRLSNRHDVRHFSLLAQRETVLRRLRERGFGRTLKRESFAVSRLDDCLQDLQRPEFAEHIWTDNLAIPQVAELIAASAGLTLAPSDEGELMGRLRRAWVSMKHIRIG